MHGHFAINLHVLEDIPAIYWANVSIFYTSIVFTGVASAKWIVFTNFIFLS